MKDKLNRKWRTSYKGQAQKWLTKHIYIYTKSQRLSHCLISFVLMIVWYRFLFKFTGKEEEINLLGDGTAKPEFKVWSWMLPEQVIEHVSFFACLVFLWFLDLVGLYHSFSSMAGCIFQETCLRACHKSIQSLLCGWRQGTPVRIETYTRSVKKKVNTD